MLRTMPSRLLHPGKRATLILAGVLIPLIALADFRNVENIPLGFLYLLPMLLLGRVLNAWATVASAALCTLLAELFDPFPWNFRIGLPRDNLYFAAFVTVGVFVYTANRNRRIVLAQLREIERQSAARQEAEEQLKVLVETSPAAIFTTGSDGAILMANGAAARMLGLPLESLPGRVLAQFFPALGNIGRDAASGQLFRAVMQSRAHRADGDTFMAEICFSTYGTRSGARLAAMVLDTSEELRTHEESNLQQVLAGSRIAVSAIAHEVRNVCGAISVVHQNMARAQLLPGNKDFEALGNLVLALESVAAVDLDHYADPATEVDLHSILDDLRIVIAPAVEEDSIQLSWNLHPALPAIRADRNKLMQIFLNLTNNAIRALGRTPDGNRSLVLSTELLPGSVAVQFLDNAGGVAHPAELFHPFQAGAHATGLGLYLSRAFARSFGGDLRYTSSPGSALFTVVLPIAEPPSQAHSV
jgi:PAS domain S-box-containing protein